MKFLYTSEFSRVFSQTYLQSLSRPLLPLLPTSPSQGGWTIFLTLSHRRSPWFPLTVQTYGQLNMHRVRETLRERS